MKKSPRKPFKAPGSKPASVRDSRSDSRSADPNAPKKQHPAARPGAASRFKAQAPRVHRSAAPARDASTSRDPRFADKARWVTGIHSCAEALKVRPKAIREIFVREDYLSSETLREMIERAEKLRITVRTKTQGQLDSVGSGHQGIAMALTESPELDWDIFEGEGKHIVLILDGLEDPQNLGSILRTAWLTGVKAVIIPEDRAVGLTPTVCKIASGGAEHIPVEAHTNLASVMKMLKDAGFWIYGLAEKGAKAPWGYKLPDKVAWVIGSEGSGMRITTERACDELVRIPQAETGSSYNASIAAAIALAETCRQMGSPA